MVKKTKYKKSTNKKSATNMLFDKNTVWALVVGIALAIGFIWYINYNY
jgi:hypothetical protein